MESFESRTGPSREKSKIAESSAVTAAYQQQSDASSAGGRYFIVREGPAGPGSTTTSWAGLGL